MSKALTWAAFADRDPELAAHGRRLLYPFGPAVGLGFLATTRGDGGPRVHPVCPAILGGGLYVFVIGHSPKRADLARDGRYALHFFPAAKDDESFYCAGPAREVSDPRARAAAVPGFAHAVRDDEALFELRLARALHTVWERPRTPETRPIYQRWQA